MRVRPVSAEGMRRPIAALVLGNRVRPLAAPLMHRPLPNSGPRISISTRAPDRPFVANDDASDCLERWFRCVCCSSSSREQLLHAELSCPSRP